MTRESLICPICQKSFYRKASAIKKLKNKTNATCSRECCYKLRKTLYSGENNPQWGLKGSKNASWKSDIRKKEGRYVLIRSPDHPHRDATDFVPRYLLVAEKYLLTDENSVEINGVRYLKQECVVHHIDFDKTNDSPDNLHIFKNSSDHTLFHNWYGDKVHTIDEFYIYKEQLYTRRVENRDWLRAAFVERNLSVNQISKMYGIPYSLVNKNVKKFRLLEEKSSFQKFELKNILDEIANSMVIS